MKDFTGMGQLGDAAYDGILATFAARAISPADFAKVRPGRPIPDPVTCLKIQCGAISQEQAGLDLLADCSFGGFAGSLTCASGLCAPYCGQSMATVARASQPLPVAPRVEQMFVDLASRNGCDPVYWGSKFGGPYSDSSPCSCGAGSFIEEHPFLSVALLGAAAYGVYRLRGGR